MLPLIAAAGLAEIPEADQRWFMLWSIVGGTVLIVVSVLIFKAGVLAICRSIPMNPPAGDDRPGERPNAA